MNRHLSKTNTFALYILGKTLYINLIRINIHYNNLYRINSDAHMMVTSGTKMIARNTTSVRMEVQ